MRKTMKPAVENARALTKSQQEVEEAKRTNQIAFVEKALGDAIGIQDRKLAWQLVAQAAGLQVSATFKDDAERILSAVAILSDIKPASAMEAQLAVQMLGVHHAALTFLRRATLENQAFEATDANVHRATRLMRLFIDQLEAMAKLKGKACQQKVTVEHVHVHAGGQAIVGAVTATKPDGGWGDDDKKC